MFFSKSKFSLPIFSSIHPINLLAVLQTVLLWIYFYENILAVGELGTALIFLAAFFFCSFLYFCFQVAKRGLVFEKHFLVFFLFVFWVSFRVIVDLDLERLKQMTIATTGGFCLFYAIGFFSGEFIRRGFLRKGGEFFGVMLISTFSIFSYLLYSSFDGRRRVDLMLLDGIEGGYQRPGNFLSMGFLIFSCVFILHLSNIGMRRKNIILFFWVFVYLATTGFLLLCAQLMGSNSATVVVLGICLISVSMVFFFVGGRFYSEYIVAGGRLPFSKVLRGMVGRIIAALIFLFFSLVWAIDYFEIDLNLMRFLNFGEGVNTSVNSRWEIILDFGIEQIAYAPVFGNANVAYLVTKNSGLTLHNFLPNLWAELGLVGIFIFSAMLFFVFSRVKKNLSSGIFYGMSGDFKSFVLFVYGLSVMFFSFVFANISAGYSWPFIWFVFGFFISPIRFAGLRRM